MLSSFSFFKVNKTVVTVCSYFCLNETRSGVFLDFNLPELRQDVEICKIFLVSENHL